jgi:hypothetical protein
MAIAYDLVLEGSFLPREATRKKSRPFSQELAEMVRHAVGYRSRAFITFGSPIPLARYDPAARHDLIALKNDLRERVGLLYKVLPTALVAATMRPQTTRAELADRIDDLLVGLAANGANLGVRTGREAVDDGVERLVERGILVAERQRVRVRDRVTLRYYARTIQHLLAPARKGAH